MGIVASIREKGGYFRIAKAFADDVAHSTIFDTEGGSIGLATAGISKKKGALGIQEDNTTNFSQS